MLQDNILQKILDLAGYQGDKEKVIEQIGFACVQLSLVDLVKSRSSIDQQKIKDDISRATNQEMVNQLLQKFFKPGEVRETYQKHLVEQINDCLQALAPVLSEDQKKNIDAYISSLKITTETKTQ